MRLRKPVLVAPPSSLSVPSLKSGVLSATLLGRLTEAALAVAAADGFGCSFRREEHGSATPLSSLGPSLHPPPTARELCEGPQNRVARVCEICATPHEEIH